MWPEPVNLWHTQPEGSTIVGAATAAGGRFPPRAWPSKDQLIYTREAITVLLMLLALPWLVWKLLTQPAAVLANRGQAALKKG